MTRTAAPRKRTTPAKSTAAKPSTPPPPADERPKVETEDERAVRIAASRQLAYEQAADALDAFVERHNAEDRVTPATIIASWRSGSEQYSPGDYAAAKVYEDITADSIYGGLQSRLGMTDKRRISAVPQLAQIAAEIIGEHLGVRSVAYSLVPLSIEHKASDAPLLVVIQRGRHTVHTSEGFLSGDLEVYLLRGDLHARLTDDRFVPALERAGWTVPDVGSAFAALPVADDVQVDGVDIRVARGWPTLPVLDVIDESSTAGVIAALGNQRHPGDTLDGSRTITYEGEGSKIVHQSVEDGVRTVEIDAVVTMSGRNPTNNATADRAQMLVPFLGGLAVAGVGRVERAQVVHFSPIFSSMDALVGGAVTYRLTAKSRISATVPMPAAATPGGLSRDWRDPIPHEGHPGTV